MKIALPATLTLALMAASASAQQGAIDSKKIHIGGSLSHNVVDSPFSGGGSAEAFGYGIFAGYELDNDMDQVKTSVELGFSQTEDFSDHIDQDISGIWVAYVAEKDLPEVSPNLFVIGRIGLDLGDDDGLLLGAGAGLHLNKQVDLRGEFINKDASSVYQASLVLNF